jgi:hypothetical protein
MRRCLANQTHRRINTNSRRETVDLSAQILRELQSQRNKTNNQQPITSEASSTAKTAQIEASVVFRHNYIIAVSEYCRGLTGFDFALTASNNNYQNAYALYTQVPFLSITGRMAFIMSLSVRRARGFWPNISILSGRLNFVNVIPLEAAIITACMKGDLLAAQTLFSERQAAPNDMTDDGKTLLYVRQA